MVDTFRRHNRVFQGGFQQRSVDDFAAARRLIQNGRIGTLKNIYCNWFGTSQAPTFHRRRTPPGLDWDMWLGPAPDHPFNSRYHPVGQRGSRTVPWDIQGDFAGGRITSSGPDHLDIAEWAMGMDDSGPIDFFPDARASDHRLQVRQWRPRADVPGPAQSQVPGNSGGFRSGDALHVGDSVLVGDRGWILAGCQGPLEASNPAILADVLLTPAAPLRAPRREDRCHLAAGPGRADLSGARLRAPRQLDSGLFGSARNRCRMWRPRRDRQTSRTWRISPPGRAARRSGIRSRRNSSGTRRPIGCARGRCGRPGRCRNRLGSWLQAPISVF